jgi:hypothetical protein
MAHDRCASQPVFSLIKGTPHVVVQAGAGSLRPRLIKPDGKSWTVVAVADGPGRASHGLARRSDLGGQQVLSPSHATDLALSAERSVVTASRPSCPPINAWRKVRY